MKQICLCILFFFSLGLPSCVPDHCKDTACGNGGVCVLGQCSCLSGYEGPDCSELWNARFIGTWYQTPGIQPEGIPVRDTFTLKTSGGEDVTLLPNGFPDQFLVEQFGGMDSILCRRTAYTSFAFTEGQEIDSIVTILSGTGTLDSLTGFINGTMEVQIDGRKKSIPFLWRR